MNRRKTMSMSVALCFGLFAGAALGQPSSPLYVDENAPGNPQDGGNWDTAFLHLQDALAKAEEMPPFVGEIRVANGTYYPDRDKDNPTGTGLPEETFRLFDNVEIKGGYAGFGAADPDLRDPSVFVTILSGDLSGDDPTSDCCSALSSPGCGNGVCEIAVCSADAECCAPNQWGHRCADMAVTAWPTLCAVTSSDNSYHVVTAISTEKPL